MTYTKHNNKNIFFCHCIVMNDYIVNFVLGLLFGYFMMYVTSNVVIYHGANSKNVKQQIITHNNKKYVFVPRIQEDKK